MPGDAVKPKQSSVIQSITSGHCVFQRERWCPKLRFSNFHRAFLTVGNPQVQAAAQRELRGYRGPSDHQLPPRPPASPRLGQRLRHVPASRSQAACDWLVVLPIARGGRVACRSTLPLVVRRR